MRAILSCTSFSVAILLLVIPNGVENAAARNVTTAILSQIKGFEKANQNWDLTLLEQINKVDGNLINFLAKYLKDFIPKRFLIRENQLTLPNLQLNLNRVVISTSDVKIHNLQHAEFVRKVSKIKLGTYNGTSGYIWPRIYVTGFYGFSVELKNNTTRPRAAAAGRRNFTILFSDLSVLYNWKLQVLPLRLKQCEPKFHVKSIKVNVGDFGKGPLVSGAVNNVLATYIQESINGASLLVTKPLEYGILSTFNGVAWLCQQMVMFLIRLVPGGEAASSLTTVIKIVSKLGRYRL